ncbi:MAG: folylpolyglutamate synthase/dihydrofolate synthase family protein [Pseudomonadota bacterium]
MSDDPALDAFVAHFGPEFGHGRVFDLKPLQQTLAALGSPQDKLPPVIHIAGTNGKGSTIAFLRAIAEAAGLRVHTFTKPHLLHLRERFRIAGETVDDDTLIAAAKRIAATGFAPTQFETQVAAAFLLFSETPADLALIETGMGGRDDATNVIAKPAAVVLTPIDLDHQDALGATLTEIAAHKAGILKPDASAVVARQAPEALAVIEAAAERIGAPLYRQGVEWDAFAQAGRLIIQTETQALDLPPSSLFGAHQVDNAGLAVATLLTLNDPRFTDDAFAQGVSEASWPGRMQPLTQGALARAAQQAGAELWLDGGHNEHAARALVAALRDLNRKRPARTALIIGMRARKDWRAFVETLASSAKIVIAVPLGPEGTAPSAIANAARAHGIEAQTSADLPNAMSAALAGGAQRILICGSLLLAGEALKQT